MSPTPPVASLADLAERVALALNERCGVRPGDAIVAACSGGADSVALVHALAHAHGGTDHPLTIVFVDHGLRDVDGERDAAQAAARAVAAPFVPLRVQVAPGANLQARARTARYAALLGVAPGALVATGHTLSDRAETVLSRLLRGAGPRGLAALPWRDGRRIRPLLGVTRAETRALGLPFVDDPSNARPDYQRNRLRQEVLPLLARENPAIETALADLADMLRAERDLLDALVRHVDWASVDLRGLDPQAIEAVLHARAAIVHDGPAPRRAPLRAWARALGRGEAGAYPLGQDVVGVARAGRATLRRSQDPRTRVVAWGPGTYRHDLVSLDVQTMTSTDAVPHLSDPARASSAWLPATALVWPVTLERVGGADQPLDLETGRVRPTHHVVDGRGAILLPRPGDRLNERSPDSDQPAWAASKVGIDGYLVTLRAGIAKTGDTGVVTKAIAKLPLER